ncbi:MAG: quinoprotein dehydrogenase-associated transporter substrate-binding protein [Gemmatimonadetes bacterium]|nr:quinoprotein dehydrogenase-associated transporter substrate-binding protein [Gemmatimonadota bacterium]
MSISISTSMPGDGGSSTVAAVSGSAGSGAGASAGAEPMASASPSSGIRSRSLARIAALVAGYVLAACAQADAGSGRASTDAKLASEVPTRELRVCADPNNLPFSNRRGEGFENELARMIGADLHARVTYTWWAQRRGFFRNTLKAGLCDVVLGMPSSVEMAWTTRPYYRSTYVFVTRRDRHVGVASLDDPALRGMRIGVQVLGDDGANPPPVHALVRRGMAANLKGYSVYGDYRQDTPPARIVDGVAKGEVDVALVWGPLAGYYARRSPVPLALAPVTPQVDLPYLPFVYDIAMGTRRGDTRLHEELDAFLRRREPRIRALLERYGIPRADVPLPAGASAGPAAAMQGGSTR